MKVSKILFAVCVFFTLISCNTKEVKEDESPVYTQKIKGDNGIYGLACDGCNDSVTVLLPENGGDPITYNSFEAKRRGKVLGKIQIGDRICVVLNKRDSTVADIVVDIDKLEGIWCYIVMPKMRDFQSMSKRLQEKMMSNMSDSLKETYLIPREYGFNLKRDWVAQSVGYVDDSSIGDESPVVYPPLGYFTAWHLLNGNFVMTIGTPKILKNGDIKVTNLKYDTCSIDYLDADSLVLTDADGSRSYYRKNDISDVNKKAKAIAEKLKKQAIEQTKQ